MLLVSRGQLALDRLRICSGHWQMKAEITAGATRGTNGSFGPLKFLDATILMMIRSLEDSKVKTPNLQLLITKHRVLFSVACSLNSGPCKI